jgi:aarF domain-containing kinase
VAVKVLHPNINEQITLDLYVMNAIKNLLLYLPGSEWLALDDALFQFSQAMQSQTNLALEGINLQKFRHNFEGYPDVIFPRFIHSSPELLIESFEKGVSLVSYLKVPHNIEEKQRLGKLGLNAFLKMMLKDNFVHADLHSGNMLVRRNPKSNSVELIMLDVGLVTSATQDDWIILKKLLVALSTNNSKMAAGLMIEHAKHKNLPQDGEVNYIREMSATFDEVFRSNMNDIDVGKILTDVLSINRRYQVQVAGNFSTLCVGCVVLEGIGKQLDPTVNLLQEAKPYLFEKEKTDFFVKFNHAIDRVLGKFITPVPIENIR